MEDRDRKNSDSETTSWLQTLYGIAHSDIRWGKEQGWQVVNWALLLFGALLGIQKFLVPTVTPIGIVLIDAFILIVAIIYLVDLHLWTTDVRITVSKIEERIPEANDFLKIRTHDRSPIFYLTIQLVVIAVAFILVSAAHFHLASLPNKALNPDAAKSAAPVS